MTVSISRLAMAVVLAFGLGVRADDAPKPPADVPKDAPKPPADAPKDAPKETPKSSPTSSVLNNNSGPQLHSAGQIVAKLSKASDGSVTIKTPTAERTTSTSRRVGAGTRMVDKDHEYSLTTDARVRWHELPKKPDGKSYTDPEYQAMREPVGTPGYKADLSDLKPGQTVRLYLSKAGKDDKPVVTVVVIVADAPKHDDKKK